MRQQVGAATGLAFVAGTLACAGDLPSAATEPETAPTPIPSPTPDADEAAWLPTCKLPGWSEDHVSLYLRGVNPWAAGDARLVFGEGASATLNGEPVEWMVMAEGNDNDGAFVKVWTKPEPVLGVLRLGEAGEPPTLDLEASGAYLPRGCRN